MGENGKIQEDKISIYVTVLASMDSSALCACKKNLVLDVHKVCCFSCQLPGFQAP
jgi:hypothetical protein